MHDGQGEHGSRWPEALRLSQVFADTLRLRIMAECHAREMSPRSFRQAVGGAPLSKIAQAFELLVQYEWLERTRSEEADPEEVEHFYRATGTLVVDDETWEALPDSTRALVVGRIVESLAARTREAMKAGTIVSRLDAHLTWTSLELDEQGWGEVIERIDAVFCALESLQERAKARLAESGEEPIAMTVGLLGFESPRAVAAGVGVRAPAGGG